MQQHRKGKVKKMDMKHSTFLADSAFMMQWLMTVR